MLRQAEAEVVTATAVAAATVIATATTTAKNSRILQLDAHMKSSGECFQICSYTSLFGCFARIVWLSPQRNTPSS
eukprot:7450830-Pyramimonas_sp.AAC.1